MAAWATAIAMTAATLAAGPLWQAFGALSFLASAALAGAGAVLAVVAGLMRTAQPQSAGSGG